MTDNGRLDPGPVAELLHLIRQGPISTPVHAMLQALALRAHPLDDAAIEAAVEWLREVSHAAADPHPPLLTRPMDWQGAP